MMKMACNIMLISLISMNSARGFNVMSRTSSHASSSMMRKTSSALFSSGGGRVSNAVTDTNLLEKTSTSKKQQKQVKLETNPPKGTRDFAPAEMRMRSWLFDKWRTTAGKFGFQEYDAPVLENEALYTRKAGEEVTQQLYCFEDKGGRRVALRPEMTPSLARIVMKERPLLPLKWYSIPQCWRYERMTRGRRREHFQWNMDIWGIPTVTAEAELLSAMASFFQSVGLTSDDVGIKLNSRLVISEVLAELQIPPEKFAPTCVLIDKLEKVPIDAIQSDLEELGLERSVVERLLTVMSGDNSLEAIAKVLPDNSEAVKQLTELMELATAYGIQDWIILDFSVVRGLAYYTGVVFEAFDRKGELRAIAGGGRYDALLETFGGDPTPAVGFGFGDAVIVELLKERKLLPEFGTPTDLIDTVVYAMRPELYTHAIEVATTLRQANQKVDVILEPNKKPKWVYKYAADRIGAKHVVLLAPDEFKDNQVSIKNLNTQEQVKVNLNSDDLSAWALNAATSTTSSKEQED